MSDDQNYLSGSRLYACLNTQKFKGLDSRNLRPFQVSKKWFTWHIISILTENKSRAHHDLFAYIESLQHPIIAILLIKILIFFLPLSSVQLLQSFQAIEFGDRHVSEKL